MEYREISQYNIHWDTGSSNSLSKVTELQMTKPRYEWSPAIWGSIHTQALSFATLSMLLTIMLYRLNRIEVPFMDIDSPVIQLKENESLIQLFELNIHKRNKH